MANLDSTVSPIVDWATKAAERIDSEIDRDLRGDGPPSVERIAAIIATHAEPLVALLKDAKRAHYHCEDTYYCCPRCTCLSDDEKPDAERTPNRNEPCTCDADAWNARVDAALNG